MNISQNFNRFYHSLLTEFFNKTHSVSFREWEDGQTGTCLIFHRYEDYDCVASPKGTPFMHDTSLKTIFKYMNTDYPLSDDGKVSTTTIDNKALCRHIDWVTKILNENGYEFAHDLEKWERMKQEAGF